MINYGSPDPHGIIGKDVQAATGANFGHRVISYDMVSFRYAVIPIQWSTGKQDGQLSTIGVCKISYRYRPEDARLSIIPV